MAREAMITQEQVNAVADSIRAGGSKPTARAVREALGGGSMATVLKYLQAWQAAQVRTAETPVVLPAGLQRVLVDFVAQEVASAKAGLQDDLVAVKQANGDLISESERQALTIEMQAESLEALQAKNAALAGRLAQLDSDLAKVVDDVAGERQAGEHARTELAKAQLRLEALPKFEAEADRQRARLEAERTAKIAAERAAAVAAAKLEGMTDRAHKAEARVEKAESQAAQAAGELSGARVRAQAQQVALDALVRECEALRRQVGEALADAKKSGEEAAELRGQFSSAKS